MVENSPDTSETLAVKRGNSEKEASSTTSLRAEVFDFATSSVKGFVHDVVKPVTGIKQIISGKPAAEIDPPSAEQLKPGYVAGAMAGQAVDFLVAQIITKKLGLCAKAATILTSGTLAALTPTQAGGLDLLERSENFTVGASSIAIFGGVSSGLKELGLKGTLAKGVTREVTAGALAGAFSAQTNSLFKTGDFADRNTTAESMLGWAATGAVFHAAGRGASRVSAELVPEVLSRAGKLETTAIKSETPVASREFVITSGKEALEEFKLTRQRGLSVQVRELLTDENGKVNLGDRKKMLVQHLSARESESRLLPAAKTADLLATCNPENLSEELQAKHVFAKAEGNVWLYTGKNNRLLLTAGDVPVEVTNVNGYKQPFKLNRGETTLSVMSDLLIGDPTNMDSEQSKAALADYRRQLEEAKKLRIDGVAIDFWWGVIEKNKGEYDGLNYYHMLTDEVIKAGLDISVGQSIHQCGGNVGDTENVPLPSWIWKDLADKFGVADSRIGMYKSEQGNFSPEYIQVWADKLAIDYYSDLMKAFRQSFAAKAPFISDINISLGPAGEMRYPSYNSHDMGVGYPTRGAMQAYSDLAQDDLRDWAIEKYGNIKNVGKAWNIPDLTVDNIHPPSDPKLFYERYDHINTQYGRDLMDWYNESLVRHGKLLLRTAQSIFGANDSPFRGTPIGAKIPGVHWRMGWKEGDQVHLSDRSAESNAGLIQTSVKWGPENAWGYQNTFNMLRELQPASPQISSPVIPSYTCLELPDGQDGPDAQSLPHTAALRFGQAAQQWGLKLDAENALSGTLYNRANWDNMTGLIRTPLDPANYYTKLTLLRMHDVVDNPVGREKVTDLINRINSEPRPLIPGFQLTTPGQLHSRFAPPIGRNIPAP